MRNPYDILGINKSATAADIKKAFRRQAKSLHPDYNKSDPKAAQKFAELNQAYEVLGDEQKRAQFDRGEIDGEGKPKFAGFSGGSGAEHPGFENFNFHFGRGFSPGSRSGSRSQARGGVEDLFADLFGGTGPFTGAQQPQSANDVEASIHIEFLEAARGSDQHITLPNGKTLKVTIPAGTQEGTVLRLKGQASATRGMPAGDVLLKITVRPHPLLKADGRDLRLTLPISLDEALLGAKIRVPTVESPVELTLPPNSNSGKTLRLRGKGLKTKEGVGDLLVTLSVVLPASPNTELKDLATNLRATAPYNPRGSEFEF